MTNPKKARGTRWESAVVKFLNEFFASVSVPLKAYRPAQAGFKDTGDIHGVTPFVIQAKDWTDTTSALREGLNGAVVQAQNAGEEYGVAVVKRRQKPVGDAYAIVRLRDLASIIARLYRAEHK